MAADVPPADTGIGLDLRGFPALDELLDDIRQRVTTQAATIANLDSTNVWSAAVTATSDALWLLAYTDWLQGEHNALKALLEGAQEEWAVVYGDHSHYRVSGSQQALQLAASARNRGSGWAYAAHRLQLKWRRMEADHG